jgi:hypothetical protein
MCSRCFAGWHSAVRVRDKVVQTAGTLNNEHAARAVC